MAPAASTYGIASRPRPEFAWSGAATEKHTGLQSVHRCHRVIAQHGVVLPGLQTNAHDISPQLVHAASSDLESIVSCRRIESWTADGTEGVARDMLPARRAGPSPENG